MVPHKTFKKVGKEANIMRIMVSVTGLAIEKAAVEAAVDRLNNYTNWTELIGDEAVEKSPLKQAIDRVTVNGATYAEVATARGE
jgi:hypothetical protein